MRLIKNVNEFMTGVFLILVALLAFYLAWPLSSRTEVGLGPGFIPKMFALVQCVLGAVLIAHGCMKPDGSSEPGAGGQPWQLRPVVLILGSVTFFAMSVERLGLVIAITGLVLLSCAANRETRAWEAAALALGSVVFSVLVFVKALGLSIALWPQMSWGA